MNMTWTAKELQLNEPFHLSYGTYTHRMSYVVNITSGQFIGIGECVAVPYYVTQEALESDLQRVAGLLENMRPEHPADIWEKLQAHRLHSFVLSAVDVALWDLYGKKREQAVHQILCPMSKGPYQTSLTITATTPAEIQSKIQRQSWPIYKMKVGFDGDMDLVEAYYKVTDNPLRLDANSGWSLAEAMEKLKFLKQYPIELIEQPLDPASIDEQQRLFSAFDVKFIADESCLKIGDIDACVGAYHGINIKLMKCGGITPAYKMIRAARKRNLMIMIGCMTESSIGISADAQLLPLVDMADLDGNLLIKNDDYNGIKAINGLIKLNDNPGTGVTIR